MCLYPQRKQTTIECVLTAPAYVGYDLTRLILPRLRALLLRIAIALAPMLVIAALVVMALAALLRHCWESVRPRSDADWQTLHALGRGLLVILLAPVALLGLLAHLSLVPLAEATTWWPEHRVERLPIAEPAGDLLREDGVPLAIAVFDPTWLVATTVPYHCVLDVRLEQSRLYQAA